MRYKKISKAEDRLQKTIMREIAEAAQKGHLKVLPKHYLNIDSISKTDAMGMNILHIAASYGKLDQVPLELLDPKALLAQDYNNMTVLHYAATNDQIGSIPKDLLTPDNITLEDEEGNTVLHHLANSGNLNKIPKELLKEDLILRKNDYGKDVLDMAIHAEFKEETVPPTDGSIATPSDESSLLTSLMSLKTLKSLITDGEEKMKRSTHGKLFEFDSLKHTLLKKEYKKRTVIQKVLQPKGYKEKTLDI
jgi:ankyrin repeat protein